MNILVMVLSCSKPPFNELYRAQRNTWDSIQHPNIETVYYWGNDYDKMHHPFRDCLKANWYADWDIIFRTNSSSYINKNMLYEYAKDLPKEKLWIGNEWGAMSGAGFIISRDLAKIVMDEIKDDQLGDEDGVIGTILNNHGYNPVLGYRNPYNYEAKNFSPCHQIRVRDSSRTRAEEISAMYNIHKTYTQ